MELLPLFLVKHTLILNQFLWGKEKSPSVLGFCILREDSVQPAWVKFLLWPASSPFGPPGTYPALTGTIAFSCLLCKSEVRNKLSMRKNRFEIFTNFLF